MDVDQGGEISLDELRDAMREADVGITKTEMDYMFRKVLMYYINKTGHSKCEFQTCHPWYGQIDILRGIS